MGLEVIITGSGNDATAAPGPAYTQYSQSFPSGSGFDLYTITLTLALAAGNPETVYCDIYAADGSDFPTGGSLGQASIASSSLNTYPSWSDPVFTFNPVVTLAASTQYCFVLSTSSGSYDTDYIYIGATLGNPYANGLMAGYAAPDWVDQSSFDISAVIRSPDLPSKPINPTPADDTAEVDFSSLQLSWEDGGDADTYNVYIGKTGDVDLVSSAQVGTTYTTTLEELALIFGAEPINQKIYWRVDATNGAGTTTGDEWNFDPRPGKVDTPIPAHEASGITLDDTIVSWDEPSINTDSYNVYYGTLSGFLSLKESGVTDLFCTLQEVPWPNYGYARYWKVNAVNDYGTTTGDEWYFTTLIFEPPTPSGITWSDPGNATGYTGTPLGTNNMVTCRRLVACADDALYYESA
jgi:hypothetical protein